MKTSIENLREDIASLQTLMGWGSMTQEQLARYKELKTAEIEAQIKTHEYLNGLLDHLMEERERERLYEAQRSSFLSNNIGDGMDQDRVDGEVRQMSDFEFVTCFGRLSDVVTCFVCGAEVPECEAFVFDEEPCEHACKGCYEMRKEN